MQSLSPSAQSARASRLLSLYRDAMFDVIDERGGWHGTDREPSFREKVWHSLALLDGEPRHVERANAILASISLAFCHFTPMTCLHILTQHGKLLLPDARSRLEAYVRGVLKRAADPQVHYTMYNDNFASLSCYTLIVGGEMFGDAEALEAGRAKLEGMRELFTRRGTVMEYGSPTYTPVHAFVLAQLAEHARDPDLKRLALQCEERMWAEIVTHWHTPTSRLAGPYSRAYWVDTVGHTHGIHALLWVCFGDPIFVNPITDLLHPHDRQVIHAGLQTLMLVNIAWFASGPCHCPARLARMLVSPRYPREVSCTSESIPSWIRGNRGWKDGRKEYFDNPWEYPGFAGPNTSWLTEDYALGAAYSSYHDGALTETFHVTYRKTRPARRIQDTGVAVARYIFNDRRPERDNYYSVFDSVHSKEAFRDEARKWGLQKRGCALYVYRPKPFECHEVSSMKLTILFPEHFSKVEEVWLAEEKLSGGEGQCAEPSPVFVKDGPVFMGFMPLTLTDHGRKAAVRVERWENYLAVSFYNYEGAVRSFDPREMLLTASGFVAHVGSDREYPDFGAFRRYAASGTVRDETTETEGGHTRWVHYTHPAADLRFAISPSSEGILIDTVDGRPRPEPIFSATGLDARKLPFLG
jgi:hypothetical protein